MITNRNRFTKAAPVDRNLILVDVEKIMFDVYGSELTDFKKWHVSEDVDNSDCTVTLTNKIIAASCVSGQVLLVGAFKIGEMYNISLDEKL